MNEKQAARRLDTLTPTLSRRQEREPFGRIREAVVAFRGSNPRARLQGKRSFCEPQAKLKGWGEGVQTTGLLDNPNRRQRQNS